MSKLDPIDMADKILDIIFLGMMVLQQISGKSTEEVMEAIKTEGKKTDQLLDKLLP